jgi:YidB-like protein
MTCALVISEALAPQSDSVKSWPPHAEWEMPEPKRPTYGYPQRCNRCIKSWLVNGSNQPIEPHQLDHAIGPDRIDQLSSQAGVPRQSLLADLARLLPPVVDSLTPQGRLPQRPPTN